MTPPRLSVVVDGQFGSCGKGAVAAWLAHPEQNNSGRRRVVAVRVGGPNAGHTVYAPRCTPAAACSTCDRWGHPWRLRQIPTAAVVNPEADLILAAGSEIDLDVLKAEVEGLEAHGIGIRHRLYVDLNATIIDPGHKDHERRDRLVERIGSTGKGIGAARAARIMREADTVRTADTAHREFYDGEPSWIVRNLMATDTTALFHNRLHSGAHVVIEGTQGYGLGLHTGYYPQTTSGDCRAIDFLAQAGISPWGYQDLDLQVWLVVRPYPIRVAGNSGPLEGETTWEALGLPEEKTTVTQKVRRVGQWDPILVQAAVKANGGGQSPVLRIALTMADHIDRDIEGATDPAKFTRQVESFIDMVEDNTGVEVALVGTSPVTLVEL